MALLPAPHTVNDNRAGGAEQRAAGEVSNTISGPAVQRPHDSPRVCGPNRAAGGAGWWNDRPHWAMIEPDMQLEAEMADQHAAYPGPNRSRHPVAAPPARPAGCGGPRH